MFIVTLYLTALSAVSVASAQQNTCPPYPHVSVEHGRITRKGYQKYGFECDKDYVLLTPATVRCFRGNWTSEEKPICHRIKGKCEEPPRVDHARVRGDERHVGSVVMYMCDEGYILLGHSSLTCVRTRHWDSIPPTCMDENEPLETVAERLQTSFVTELESYSADTMGRMLDSESVALGLELVLLIDRSSSVDPVHLQKAKDFVKFLLEKFHVRNTADNKNGTRAAVLTFAKEVQTVFDIDNVTITSHVAAAAAIDKIQPNGGGTNMQDALTGVIVETFKLRKEAKRALFLLSDGEPNIVNPGASPQDLAGDLKRKYKFEIFTVGVGSGINRGFLTELASEPPLSHVFVLKDYSELEEVMRIIQDSKPPPPPIGKDQCGYNATGEDRPWLASLYIGGSPFKMCSGVLICSQWVLTIATCLQQHGETIDKKDVFVVLGERHLLEVATNQTNFYVTDMRIHPNFDPGSIQSDVALLRLELPASKYRPACLPPTDRGIPLHLELQVEASIAGWGQTSASEVTYAKASDVAFNMSSTSVSLSGEQECPIQERGISLLCAGKGTRSCYGLMGSPLVVEEPSTGFRHVLGLLVHRRQCSRGQNQYVELASFVNWINRETSDCQLKHWGPKK